MTTTEDSRVLLLKACEAAGLPTDSTEPIRIGENALWRLPNRVVVRIARPGQWDAAVREIAVARWLRKCDVPAVRPLDSIAGPLDIEGRPVTVWHELPPHRTGTSAELAPLLRRLHQLPIPDFTLGTLDPFVRLADRIDSATTIDHVQRDWLHHRLVDLQAAWSDLGTGQPWSVIHGDAWRGNVAATPSTAYLLDFERTSLGPPEWDLTVTAVGYGSFGSISRADYAAFCAAYGGDVTTWDGYAVLRDIRELRVTCFALQHAAADPASYGDQARYRLECIQGLHGARPWGWNVVG